MKLLIATLLTLVSSYSFACSSNFQCGIGEKCVKPAGSNIYEDNGECLNTGGQQLELTQKCNNNFDCNTGYRCTTQFGNGVCVKR